MDYEKKDSENTAVKTIMRMIANGEISQEVAEKYFPELKESEDEKICRKLIAFFKQCKAVYGDGFKQFKLDIDDALAWLEKQGEQTSSWSEDDQSNFNELSSFIFETYRTEDASRLLIWFKSLKERIQPDKGWIPIKESFYANNVVLAQKKDKSDVWEGYTVIADHTLDPLVFERYINIENISALPHWKPSEEQMRVLDLAIRCGINRGTTEESTLVSLFNNLKKLRGK